MSEAVFKLQNVCFRWSRQGPLVLDIRSFEAAAGERVFLYGPSGAGKTTLLNVVGGVAQPESGAVLVGDVDLASLGGGARDRRRADQIGFIFQMFNLLPYLSATENVLLPCRFSPRRRRMALERSGGLAAEARRLLARMALDADALADAPVAKLSVGQQQRVAAARALIGAPALVVADEPTSALDEAARDRFIDLLFEEAAAVGAAVLLVSHDRSFAGRFDRAVALRDINRAALPEEADRADLLAGV